MSHPAPTGSQSVQQTLDTERSLDNRLLYGVLKAGGVLFLAFIIAVAFG